MVTNPFYRFPVAKQIRTDPLNNKINFLTIKNVVFCVFFSVCCWCFRQNKKFEKGKQYCCTFFIKQENLLPFTSMMMMKLSRSLLSVRGSRCTDFVRRAATTETLSVSVWTEIKLDRLSSDKTRL